MFYGEEPLNKLFNFPEEFEFIAIKYIFMCVSHLRHICCHLYGIKNITKKISGNSNVDWQLSLKKKFVVCYDPTLKNKKHNGLPNGTNCLQQVGANC